MLPSPAGPAGSDPFVKSPVQHPMHQDRAQEAARQSRRAEQGPHQFPRLRTFRLPSRASPEGNHGLSLPERACCPPERGLSSKQRRVS
jgi:hypothetical protein